MIDGQKVPNQSNRRFSHSRLKKLGVAATIVACILLARATYISSLADFRGALDQVASRQHYKNLVRSPFRGNIYDRGKNPLALSVMRPSIAINPRIFHPNKSELNKFCEILRISPKRLRERMSRKSFFVWIKRKVGFGQAEKIEDLALRGVRIELEPSRFYPEGKNASNLVGYTGTDNLGLLGIEYAYETILSQDNKSILEATDAFGRVIYTESSSAKPETSGSDVYLTIDHAIQQISAKSLTKWARKSQAKRGFVIVMDPHSGRILALANYPSFDPNTTRIRRMSETNNFATNYLFEPGSVLKPLIIARALDQNLITASEIHYCENGVMNLPDRTTIRDDHPLEFATTAEIIIESSNICTYKVAQKIGKEKVYNYLKKALFSFDRPLGLPGEARGQLSSPDGWKPIRFSNISFGQGLLVSGLQVATVYNAIANGGFLPQPYVVEKVGRRVFQPQSVDIAIFSSETAQRMRSILYENVLSGTGTSAQPPSYSAGGKTGTSEKIDPQTGAYSKTLRTAGFAGFAPVEDPHITIYVVIDEPAKKPYYGSKWAAPAFAEIAEQVLKYLNVASNKTT